MVLLSTGFIIAGAYAGKVRKTLFAQLRDHVKRGEVSAQEVARAAELNRALYHILVERLKSDKGDAIKAKVEYDVEGAGRRREGGPFSELRNELDDPHRYESRPSSSEKV